MSFIPGGPTINSSQHQYNSHVIFNNNDNNNNFDSKYDSDTNDCNTTDENKLVYKYRTVWHSEGLIKGMNRDVVFILSNISPVSVINFALLAEIKCKYTIEPLPKKFPVLYNWYGKSLEPVGIIRLRVRMGKNYNMNTLSFAVTKNLFTDVIIGADVLFSKFKKFNINKTLDILSVIEIDDIDDQIINIPLTRSLEKTHSIPVSYSVYDKKTLKRVRRGVLSSGTLLQQSDKIKSIGHSADGVEIQPQK